LNVSAISCSDFTFSEQFLRALPSANPGMTPSIFSMTWSNL